MSDAQKLATLLLHLELNPEELKGYQASKETARRELEHFGISPETIEVVLGKNLEAFGKLFDTLGPLSYHVSTGAAVVERSHRKK